ncbi:MAG: ABC transporter substrate-binding protein [Bacteroidetes bacterium]|nr:ABC transporter substrate-binding protein [Bacteroidota bacterium]MCL5027341.1 ABC transporter substrate-binding protein [Chloroflexota bacterium]
MRTFWKTSTLILILVLMASCSPAAPTAAPAKPAAAPTTAPAAAPTTATAAKPAATTAPAAAPTPAVNIKRGGILVHATGSFPPSMDPIYDTLGTHLKEMGLYEALLRYEVTDFKEGKLELKPELAESWQQVDPKTITLKLRKGVKFHDGSDFNAEVAKWSLERMGNRPKSLSKRFMENVTSIEVVDPYTIKINYKAQSALQAMNLTVATAGTGSIGPAILSKAQMDAVGEEAFGQGKVSGTGPLKIVEWKRDSEFVLTRFDNYWKDGADGKKLPYLDGMRYRLIPDNAVQLTELKAGTLHMTRALAPADLPSIRSNPDLQTIMIKWGPSRYYYGFNQKKEPFGTNIKLRQAAEYATDRENMAKVFGLDAGTPDYLIGWTPAWSGYDPKLKMYDFNPDKAAALVKEAGYPNGVEIELLHQIQTQHRRMAEMIQGMWAKAGIKLNLLPADQAAAREKIKLGEFQMHIWSMAPSPDPAYYERMFTCEGAANWNNYCNKETDKCMFEAQAELDPTKRADMYKKCEKIVQEEAMIGGMYLTDAVLTYRKEVHGLKMQTHSEDVQEVWLDK